MYQYEKVSSSEAMQLIQHVVKESEKINKVVAVAVTGPEGELISFLRMDGVNAASSVISQNKAYTAARDRKSTREMGKYMREKESPPAFWGDKGITGFGGGFPISQNGRVIGGIGVSGLSQDEDERIAMAAIKSVYK
ncbi:MAG: heme-binding protein [Bacteroidia bacterium]|nr:heme-binding protein [Bacteroidia bacterium]